LRCRRRKDVSDLEAKFCNPLISFGLAGEARSYQQAFAEDFGGAGSARIRDQAPRGGAASAMVARPGYELFRCFSQALGPACMTTGNRACAKRGSAENAAAVAFDLVPHLFAPVGR
jgi:hypothetical protein